MQCCEKYVRLLTCSAASLSFHSRSRSLATKPLLATRCATSASNTWAGPRATPSSTPRAVTPRAVTPRAVTPLPRPRPKESLRGEGLPAPLRGDMIDGVPAALVGEATGPLGDCRARTRDHRNPMASNRMGYPWLNGTKPLGIMLCWRDGRQCKSREKKHRTPHSTCAKKGGRRRRRDANAISSTCGELLD